MLYIDDDHYDEALISHYFKRFDKCEVVNQCAGKRFTVCFQGAALWIALCLYIKNKGGSVFPLPADTPISTSRLKASQSESHFLLIGQDHDNYSIEVINTDVKDVVPGLVQMSSGTTGEPKIVARSWIDIDTEIDSYKLHFPEANNMQPIIAAPIHHSYGLICGVLVALKRGLPPLVITNLNPKYIIRKAAALERPLLYSSPTLLASIAMLNAGKPSIYAVMTSGTLLHKSWFDKVKNLTRNLYQQYGCSELGCVSLGKNVDEFDDIGMPLPHLRVLAGEEIDKPSSIMVLAKEEYEINTGDIGYFDKKGALRFVSRTDDMINVSGLNVYPIEVEQAVLEMDGIEDAVIYRRKSSIGHDQVSLDFVAHSVVSSEDIRKWCRKKLASHQIPMIIRQVKTINKLPSGKVNRKKIAEAI